MNETTRRGLLRAAVGCSVAGTAGCLALGGGSEPEPTATPTTDRGPGELRFGQGFSENGVRAQPTDPVVQRSVLHETEAGALDVHTDLDRQYLFVEVETGGSPGIDLPAPDDFSVVFGDEAVRATQTVASVPPGRLRPDDHEEVYDTAAEREVTDITGWLAVPLPRTGDFERAVLSLRPTEPGRPRASWNLPERTRAALAATPSPPTVEGLSVPASVESDAAIPVTVTTGGDGSVPARLRLGINVDGTAATAARVDVPAGEAATWEGTVDPPATGSTTVEVRTATERLTRTVEVGGG